MARHSNRGTNGRFTPAPVPEADTSVDNLSGRPGEDAEAYPEFHESYPVHELHDFVRGPVTSLIPHRRVVEIDGETGEALREVPDHELRALDTRTGAQHRQAAHLAAAEGDLFATNLMGAAIGPETRSRRRAPGVDGYRLPAMGQSDRDAEWRGGR